MGGFEFLKPYGNFPLVALMKDSTNFFQWSDNEPTFRTRDQQSCLLLDAVQKHNVKYLVPILYCHLKPFPKAVLNHNKGDFSTTRSGTDSNIQVDPGDLGAKAAEHMIVAQNYQGIYDETVQTNHTGDHFPEDGLRMPSYLMSYTVEPGGLFSITAPMVYMSGTLSWTTVQTFQCL